MWEKNLDRLSEYLAATKDAGKKPKAKRSKS